MGKMRIHFAAATTALVLIGILLTGSISYGNSEENYEQIRLVSEVLAIVQKNFVQEPGARELMRAAIRGMLNGLEPSGSFIEAEEYQEMQNPSKEPAAGVGLTVNTRDGFLRVVDPLEGLPADRAGILTGDWIVRINGRPTWGMDVVQAVRHLHGHPGDKVDVEVGREGVPGTRTFTLAHEEVPASKSVKARELDRNISYLRITTFRNTTVAEFDEMLASLHRERGADFKGLIIDLRNNPGGLLASAIELASRFVGSGVIVSIKGRVPGEGEDYRAKEGKVDGDYPVCVLINQGSAGASEIVAGALHDHHRATLVGSRTNGKGSVSTIYKLTDGSAVRITTHWYYTPDGHVFQDAGIEADIVVRNRPTGTGDQPTSGSMSGESIPEDPAEDDQLQKALSTLREKIQGG